MFDHSTRRLLSRCWWLARADLRSSTELPMRTKRWSSPRTPRGCTFRKALFQQRLWNCSTQPGSLVKLRGAAAIPPELREIQKRIGFIVHRMEDSISNHEFEKARFYSVEERKERQNLRALRETYKLDDSAPAVVGLKDVEEMVARWASYPLLSVKGIIQEYQF